jgi:integrase
MQWDDFNWTESFVFIQRGIVAGTEDGCENVRFQSNAPTRSGAGGNPPAISGSLGETGSRVGVSQLAERSPYSMHYIQQEFLEPAGIRAGLGKGLGWHSFRQTYSTLLRHLKVDMKVQQSLLRHTDIRTTMNRYTLAVPDDMRRPTAMWSRWC